MDQAVLLYIILKPIFLVIHNLKKQIVLNTVATHNRMNIYLTTSKIKPVEITI